MGEMTLNQIIGFLGIIASIITPIVAIYKVYKKEILDKFEKIEKQVSNQQIEINKLKTAEELNKKESILLIKSIQACLKGLKEQGCNGPVTEAINNIDEYLLQASH